MAVWNVIDHEELTGTATSWTSVTIPSTYDHLHLLVSARTDQSTDYSALLMQFNGDSGSNYSYTEFLTFSTFLSVFQATGQTAIGYPMVAGSTNLADTFGIMDVWIPNYTNTSLFKQLTCNSAAVNNNATAGNFQSRFTAGMWSNAAAITSITLSVNSGDDFVQYSSFTLYGINGAG